MANPDLPAALHHLVIRALASIDHAAVLLAVRRVQQASGSPVAFDAAGIGALLGMAESLAVLVLGDLHRASLLSRVGSTYLFTPHANDLEALAQLDDMYNTRPVTLVRAIFDRAPESARAQAAQPARHDHSGASGH